MTPRQPIGIKIWAGLLVLSGGFASLVTVLEVIDSIRFDGLDSIAISSLTSLAGFVVYGTTPILLYSVGVGLFMNRWWSRQAAVFILPFLLFLFFLNQAMHVATLLARKNMSAAEVTLLHFDIFSRFFMIYLIFIVPLVFYFCHKNIKSYYLLQEK